MKKLLAILFLFVSSITFAQHQFTTYVTASGTDTYSATISVPTITSYTTKRIHIRFSNPNAGASTLNITPSGGSALGAIAIRAWDGDSWEPLVGGEIDSGQDYIVVYNGTYFELYPSIGGGEVGSGEFIYSIQTISGTTHTINAAAIGDLNKWFIYTNASGCTVTMDEDVDEGRSVVAQRGPTAGTVTFQDDGTSTLTTASGDYDLEAVNRIASWTMQASNNWHGVGELGPAASGGTQDLQSVLDEGSSATVSTAITAVSTVDGDDNIFGVNDGTEAGRLVTGKQSGEGVAQIESTVSSLGSSVVSTRVSASSHYAEIIALNSSANGSSVTVDALADEVVIKTDNTTRITIDSDGSWDQAGTTPGTAGQGWISNGASSPPTWQDISVTDGDKGDITITGGVWDIDAGSIGATELATISSSALAGKISDETGTAGSIVLSGSPALTGSPTAPTQSPGTDNTTIATTAFVTAAVAAGGGGGGITNGAASNELMKSDGTNAVSSGIFSTASGEITTGTWSGSDIGFSRIAQGTALSVLGVAGNSTSDNASIAAGTDNQVMRRSGTSIGFGAVNIASSDAVTGILPIANGGTGSSTAPWIALTGTSTITTPKLVGNMLITENSGDAITANTVLHINAGTGDTGLRVANASNQAVVRVDETSLRLGTGSSTRFAPAAFGSAGVTGTGMLIEGANFDYQIPGVTQSSNIYYRIRTVNTNFPAQNGISSTFSEFNSGIVNTTQTGWTWKHKREAYTINSSGGSGTVIGLELASTETATTGITHYQFLAPSTTGLNGFGTPNPTARLHVVGSTKLEGSVTLPVAGNGISIKEGTNATMGTATLSAGTVTVNTTAVTANSRIFLTVNGGTLTNVGSTYISARSAGTSFTITSTNVLDASNVAWIIIEPAP